MKPPHHKLLQAQCGTAFWCLLPALQGVLLCAVLTAPLAMANEAQLSDPMRPSWYGLKARSKGSSKDPQLSSIIASEERRLAVINVTLMREGDRKNGVLLRQVLPDRVLVVTADQRLRALKLSKPKIAKEQR